MRKLLFSVAVLLSLTIPVHSQTVSTCQVIDDFIPAGERYSTEPEPGYISGEIPGSKVNIRTGPGSEYEAETYGLVGDAIEVVGQAFSTECETWIQVRFPVSGHIGWIHSTFLSTGQKA